MNWNKTIVSTVTWFYSISYCYIYVTVFVIVIIVVWYLESLMVWKFKIIVMVQNVLFRICKHVIGWFCFICLIQIYLKFTQCIQWGYYECEFTFHHCYHSVYGMATMSNVCKWYALFFNKEFWTCRLYVTKHTKQYAITILQLAFYGTMTSWNGKFSVLLALCEGNPPVTGGFPSQSPVTRNVDVFCDLRRNKRRKQSRRR